MLSEVRYRCISLKLGTLIYSKNWSQKIKIIVVKVYNTLTVLLRGENLISLHHKRPKRLSGDGSRIVKKLRERFFLNYESTEPTTDRPICFTNS